MKFKTLFLAGVLSIASANVRAEDSPKCLEDYHKLRNRYALKTGLFPVAGFTGIAESAVLAFSWEYGGLGAFKAGLGAFLPVASYAVSHVIPTVALLGTLGYETYFIVKLTETNRGYRLLKDAYGFGSGKMLHKFTRSVQKKNPEITEEQIRTALIEADQQGLLCDGSWTKHGQNHTAALRKRVALPRDIRRQLLRSEILNRMN